MTHQHALPRSTPEAQGVSSTAILNFVNAVEADIQDLHSFILVRHGHIIAEGWWAPYGPDTPHMLFSLSKSFTSTAVGMAVAEGLLSVDDKVAALLPDDMPSEVSENLANMRVHDLLSMSTGNDQDTMGALRDNKNWAKAILAQPVEHTPGTHFVYNSGATYLLSAIVQKLTGQRLLDYLTPRLFEPLGIEDATWQQCPRGIDTGGWGLKVKTEDIANFGQLYLQNGQWEGKQLVPANWVAEASRKQVSNTHHGKTPDWTQGYGYQFWRCQNNAYRGDGAFGQYCVIMPDQDAVLAITSGVGDMQKPLDKVWEILLPAMTADPLPANPDAQNALASKLSQLVLPFPVGQTTSPIAEKVSGQRYNFAKVKSDGFSFNAEAAQLTFTPEQTTLTLWDKHGQHDIFVGQGAWVRGTTQFGDGEAGVVAASGAWADEHTYVAKLYYYDSPFAATLRFHFSGSNSESLELSHQINVSFGPAEPVRLQGTVAVAI